MSDPYERAKGGRLTFKGGGLAARKSTDTKRKKKKKNKKPSPEDGEAPEDVAVADAYGGADSASTEIYTIDAAKRMKYDDLFPVEAKKFGYDPNAKSKSVEDALDDRVKKKADRYCK